MDFDGTPLFTSGKELAYFLLTDGIIWEAWELIPKDFANNANAFVAKEDEDVVYFVFPSFLEDFSVGNDESRVFSDYLKGDDGQPALVHGGAFNLFKRTVLYSDFESQMQSIINRKKDQNIIFVGHSIGGSVATLATIWLLEKRLEHISLFCITFGCPLVGDARLGQAIGREDWSGKFCHVVSQYDVIPRMLLAPVESIAKHVDAILPYWVSITCSDSPSIQEACRTILKNILQYTSLFAKNDMEEPSLESPYRPFATYMFCSMNGAACIEDPRAILSMLHFTLQSNKGNSFDARACVSEHTCYGDILKHIIGDLANTRRIVSPVSDSSFEVQLALILEAIGVGAEYKEPAGMALREAGKVKNMFDTITRELNAELDEKQGAMAELEWYKTRCQSEGRCYYDLFKEQNRRDQRANLYKITLDDFWDNVIDKENSQKLPRDFYSQNRWINAATAYRRLVEPLEIAYYYHTKKGRGSYFSPGIRPIRQRVLEKWFKEKDKTRSGEHKKPRTKFASLTKDSCFWAYLEDAYKDLKNLQGEQDLLQCAQHMDSLKKFEDYVWKMIEDRSISKEIFLQESSFMKWWQEYSNAQLQSPEWQARSSLLDFMRKEKW